MRASWHWIQCAVALPRTEPVGFISSFLQDCWAVSDAIFVSFQNCKRNFRSETTAPFSLIAGEIIALTSHSNNVVFDSRVSVIIHVEHPHGKNGLETSPLMWNSNRRFNFQKEKKEKNSNPVEESAKEKASSRTPVKLEDRKKKQQKIVFLPPHITRDRNNPRLLEMQSHQSCLNLQTNKKNPRTRKPPPKEKKETEE